MLASSSITASPRWPHADSAIRYGTVSRWFHWGMALCFVGVFAAALVHHFLEDSALDGRLWPLHRPLGALLLLLVLLRAAWALRHANRRPPHVSRAARVGHLALYALMAVVPFIGLLRQYGSGRAFAPFGMSLMPGRADDKIDWMVHLGGLLHGELGWVLLAGVAGHIAMTVWHRRHGAGDVLPRMIG